MSDFEGARELIRGFKGDNYASGAGALTHTGELAAQLGKSAAMICAAHPGAEKVGDQVKDSLRSAGVTVLGELIGAAPNTPREDVFRLGDQVSELKPEVIVVIGGGSNIDAAKAASVLATLSGPIDRYFGTALVTDALRQVHPEHSRRAQDAPVEG